MLMRPFPRDTLSRTLPRSAARTIERHVLASATKTTHPVFNVICWRALANNRAVQGCFAAARKVKGVLRLPDFYFLA